MKDRPLIQKHGTIRYGTVETTPIVFRNRLYRFEYIRPAYSEMLRAKNPMNPHPWSFFRFLDVETGEPLPPFGKDHHLGCAYTEQGRMVAFGVDRTWGGDTLHFFSSEDLRTWEQLPALHLPGWKIFNSGICRWQGRYLLLMEISEPAEEAGVPFTFRFAVSEDLKNWQLTPRECVFQKDRYAGGPAIYTIGDGWVYILYLEAGPGRTYTNCIARSRDLMQWEKSPLNPVLMYDPEEDKRIADPTLPEGERQRIREARDVNNSDLELCEYQGKTVMYYSWGDQQGTEFLAEAVYDGSMKAFLQGWFPEKEENHGDS